MSTSEQQPRRKRKPGCLQWLLGILILLVLLASCGALLGGDEEPATDTTTSTEDGSAVDTSIGPPPEETTPPAEDTVRLEATSSGGGTVVWGAMDGGTNSEEFQGAWTRELPDTDDTVYTIFVSGDIMDTASEVSCKVYVNDELVDEATGSGDMGSASCSQPIFG